MRSVLKAISTLEGGIEEKRLQKQIAGEEKDLNETLAFLIRRDILLLEDGVYSFRAKLLGRWVARQ